MKKLLIVLLIVAFAGAHAYAEEPDKWHLASSGVVGWDPVTTSEGNGEPLPIDFTKFDVSYMVYSQEEAGGSLIGQPVEVGETVETEKAVTLDEGRYFLGVKAIKCFKGTTDCVESTISWSTDPLTVANGETWGMKFIYVPHGPVGLKNAGV